MPMLSRVPLSQYEWPWAVRRLSGRPFHNVLPDHRATEAYLKKCGIEYNIMRNNLYMENYLSTSVMLALLSNNVWGTNAREAKATYIAKDDSGACGAALLLGKVEHNMDYDLISLEPASQRGICKMIAERSGIDFHFSAYPHFSKYDV